MAYTTQKMFSKNCNIKTTEKMCYPNPVASYTQFAIPRSGNIAFISKDESLSTSIYCFLPKLFLFPISSV